MEKKSSRLSKAAKEFNVGRDQIYNLLISKGFDISNKPSSKLTPEMVQIVSEEFQDSKKIKEEAKSIETGLTKEQILSIKPSSEKTKEPLKKTDTPKVEVEKKVEEQISKKTPEVEATPKKEVEELKVDEKKKEDTLKPEPADISSKEKDAVPEVDSKKVEEIPSEVVKEEPIEVVEKTVQEEKIKETPVDKTEEEKVETPILKEEKDSLNKEESPKDEVKAESIEQEVKKTESVKQEPKEEESIKQEPKKETKKLTRPKIVDKIDLDSEKKKKEEKKSSKESSPQKEEPKVEASKEAAPKEEEDHVIRAKVDKLTGPKVLGTIELKEEKKPTKRESPWKKKKEERKKKRARIVKQKVSPKSTTATTGDRKFSKKRPAKKKIERKEVSAEDVQKQVKETLAKLTNKNKNKGAKLRREKRRKIHDKREEEIQLQVEQEKILQLTEFITVGELANLMDVGATEVIGKCMGLGMFVSINQRLDAETIQIVADEFEYEVNFIKDDIPTIEVEEEVDRPEDLKDRAPVVTIMGHVDHGKTKLLDFIRSENVVAGEAGGITQHIGAYEVTLKNGKQITFLDTPGHEAFTAMRARGAQVTDIVVIVVAADDGVMPQTKEAINHAKMAEVPIIIAINKMDKPTANPDKVKEELANLDILVEDWGGKFQNQEISAITGSGIDELLDKILLEAELLELKANPNKRAKGTVLESSLDKGRGYISNLLIIEGTLKVGDYMVAGSFSGKVRALYNERDKKVKSAGPATPVSMIGLDGSPMAGDPINVFSEEQDAKSLANKRKQILREQAIRTKKHITLDEIGRRLALGDFKELNLIIKGDVDGSVEALSVSLEKLSSDNVAINIIHKGVGQISDSDVLLASASDAIIVGFQVRPSLSAKKMAEKEQVDIRLYSIIYQAIDEMTEAIQGMLSPIVKERITGNIEVREVFKITKVGTVAGCYVRDGFVNRNSKIRLIRDGIVIYSGDLASLKRFKNDVKEVKAGYECGLGIAKYNDIKVGDVIEGYEEYEEARKL